MLSLTANDIHLWWVKPESIISQALLQRYWTIVSADEEQRIKGYHNQRQQHDGLITRVLVRYVLSQYEQTPEEGWCFSSTAEGKPHIDYPAYYLGRRLSFNVSHTAGMIVCAVTVGQAVGCDVEWLARKNSLQAIAEKYFSPQEQAALFRLPEPLQRRRFFDLWTLKESYVKACGQGLSMGLDSISFTIAESENQHVNCNVDMAAVTAQKPEHQWQQSWLIFPSEAFTAAITVIGPSSNDYQPRLLRCFDAVPLESYQEVVL
ncbi:hypothetical protein SIN8267_02886 [Sinobacterium norvegicum]|uniref:4'-phosphopantetheinyl transferase n=1 Tax=Sinobacterium norvegicum TaxID=1641715 RepID=A0ABM9AHQ2_9GAMM|nr:4'-phosphopantetheinyl transferase superfamily protein [Sinobacterium norvegicum]CAH0992749.1 hypothetical protein SIN8267_02886 [Sinobacterium norvegicum]